MQFNVHAVIVLQHCALEAQHTARHQLSLSEHAAFLLPIAFRLIGVEEEGYISSRASQRLAAD